MKKVRSLAFEREQTDLSIFIKYHFTVHFDVLSQNFLRRSYSRSVSVLYTSNLEKVATTANESISLRWNLPASWTISNDLLLGCSRNLPLEWNPIWKKNLRRVESTLFTRDRTQSNSEIEQSSLLFVPCLEGKLNQFVLDQLEAIYCES